MNPYPLDEELLHTRLVESGQVPRLVRVESTGSTNADLVDAADSAEFGQQWPHLSVLTAEEQKGGRGRQVRAWSSPRGASLSTSVVLRPALPLEQRHWLTLATGLALIEALGKRGLPAALKWPNDVHVNGRKIAGILAVVPPGSPESLIIGCGINALLTQEQLPTPTATSVLLELERAGLEAPSPDSPEAAVLRTELLADWLAGLVRIVQRIQDHGDIEPVRADTVAAISTVGEEVRVELPDGTGARGTAVGIEYQGALIVEVTSRRRTVLDPEAGGGEEYLWQALPQPVCESFTAGDVVHLRPLP